MQVQRWLLISEIVRNFGLLVGGGIGIYLGWLRVNAANKQAEAQIKQADLARQDHVAELFNRAGGQLKDEKLEVRLCAILTLGQICKNFPDLANPAIHLLTTHLRENAISYANNDPPADVAEILYILRLPLESKP